MANQSQSPLPPPATAAAAALEEVRLWDRDCTIPASAHVEVEEGLGLEEGHRTGQQCHHRPSDERGHRQSHRWSYQKRPGRGKSTVGRVG